MDAKASRLVIQQKRSGFWYDYWGFPEGAPQEEIDAWIAGCHHAPNWPDSPEYIYHDYRVIRRTDEILKDYPGPARLP